MRGEKAQGIIEFLVVFMAIFFFFILFLTIIQDNIHDKNLEKENIIAMDLALSVQDEVSLAAKSSDGYYREFILPNALLGKEYDMTINESRVIITADKIAMSFQVSNVTGNVQKGLNIIQKQNGEVLLNQ